MGCTNYGGKKFYGEAGKVAFWRNINEMYSRKLLVPLFLLWERVRDVHDWTVSLCVRIVSSTDKVNIYDNPRFASSTAGHRVFLLESHLSDTDILLLLKSQVSARPRLTQITASRFTPDLFPHIGPVICELRINLPLIALANTKLAQSQAEQIFHNLTTEKISAMLQLSFISLLSLTKKRCDVITLMVYILTTGTICNRSIY